MGQNHPRAEAVGRQIGPSEALPMSRASAVFFSAFLPLLDAYGRRN
jgi:hypothetical protein